MSLHSPEASHRKDAAMLHITVQPLASQPGRPLTGTLEIPGDKSISHRCLLLGAVATGHTTIAGLLEGEDVLNTARAVEKLGATVSRAPDGLWHVDGVGVSGLISPASSLDFGNSGTGVRLAMGLMATNPIEADCVGDASLSRRPMARVTTPLSGFGTRFETAPGARLPLKLYGARFPVPQNFRMEVASAQVKSAMLLAALNTPGMTSIIEPVPTRDHTERMLTAFGAKISLHEQDGARLIRLEGQHELTAQNLTVPGDPSSAAFPMVAALLVPGSHILIQNVMLNETRTGLITTLIEMGARITIINRRMAGGEEIGDLDVQASRLHGISVPADRAPSMIDEYPVLAIAASFAQGTTRMKGLEELRVKESDRLAAIESGLRANGVVTQSGPDWLEITGGPVPGGACVTTHLDHRIAMAFLVMGLASTKPVSVDDGAMIATSFPGFVELMNKLGANIAQVP